MTTTDFIINSIIILIELIGIIGNTLILIVFSSQCFRKLSVSVYFRAMAISDLVINLVWMRQIYSLLNSNISLETQSIFWCRAINSFLFIGNSTSSWFQVAAGLDRLLTIVYPTRFKFIKMPSFSYLFILSILLVNILIYSPFVINLNLDFDIGPFNSTINCHLPRTPAFLITDCLNTTGLPFVIMIVLTILTFSGVHRSHRSMTARSSSNGHKLNDHARKILKRDLKFGATLILLNVVFLVLKMPYFILATIMISGVGRNFDQTTLSVLDYFVNCLLCLLFSANFLLQLASNSLVRKQFKKCFEIFTKIVSKSG